MSGSDGALIRASREDPSLFQEVFQRHYRSVHGFVARRYGPEVADEVAAETFLQAFAGRSSFDPSCEDARPWLLGIARNQARSLTRRQAKEHRALSRLGSMTPGGPNQGGEAVSSWPSELSAVLSRLPEGELDVLLLIAWEDLTYQKASETLGVPVGTVRSRLHRARSAIRDALQLSPDPAREE